jgi:4-amino-4-deoxy-L-arabinose transferase-like glycosyltransferase
VFLLGFMLRIVNISSRPIGFTPDEASFGYDAYSLLKTGRDQWGKPFPLVLRSFGDFKPALYAYLAIPSVAAFGLNEFAVRMPNVIIGSLAIIIVYFLVLELFRDNKFGINHYLLAVASSFLLVISPWHIPLSRGAFEANLTVLFLSLGIYLFLKGLNKPWLFILSVFILGLNLFSYHSARLITPLIIIYLLVWKKDGLKILFNHKDNKLILAVSTLILVVSLAVAGWFLLSSARTGDIAIFNPTDKWFSVSEKRYKATLMGLPDYISRLFTNKITYSVKIFINNYLSYFSPQYLFTQGVSEWTYGMIAGRGALYLIEAVFILFAIWYIVKTKQIKLRAINFLLFWILISVIPAALTKGVGYAGNRTAIMMPAIQILSAYGGCILFEQLSKKVGKKIIVSLFLFCLGFSLIGFIEEYFFQAPVSAAGAMLYGRKEAFKFIKNIEKDYQTIIVSRSLSEPHIHVAFYFKWDPDDYRKQSQDWLVYEKEGKFFVDQLGKYQLGKYVFTDINYESRKNSQATLLVGKPEEFPENVFPLKTIFYPDGKKAMLVVDPLQNVYAKAY